ncbi:MAG: hypothetical protein AAF441_01945, partial [Pseudomonadota bacterium]
MKIGNEFLNAKEHEKAEKTFRKALKDDSSNNVYKAQLSLSLIEQSKHSDAQQILDEILLEDSLNMGALWYSCINNFKSGEFKRSIEACEIFMRLIPEDIPQFFAANYFLGKSYKNLLLTEGISYTQTQVMLNAFK